MTTHPVYEHIAPIIQHLKENQATPILVGGCVRDHLLGLPIKDIDIEVFGVDSLDALETLLQPFGSVHDVGKQFQVLKLNYNGSDLDFSLPRSEVKTGDGHRGFRTEALKEATFKDAASRRDFTINAMGINLLTDTLLDPFNGQADLNSNTLRHVGPAFVEDPLRVLRGMQFAARFNLAIAPETLELCQRIDISELPCERLFEEFKKLLLKAPKPSLGLDLLEPLGILDHFPELKALKGVQQDPEWHPEGDVWVHTLMVVDEMALAFSTQPHDEKKKLVLMLAALCHDFGKALKTVMKDGRWKSPGHEPAGEAPTRCFLARLTDDKALTEAIIKLVIDHQKPLQLYLNSKTQTVSNAAIRRLALRVDLKDLITLSRADSLGRTNPEALNRQCTHVDWLEERARDLDVLEAPPSPLIKGEHLLPLGYSPGPRLGQLLRKTFDAQLNDEFSTLEDGLNWVKRHFH